MKNILTPIYLFLSILTLSVTYAQHPDSLKSASYIQRQVTYQEVFPFVRYERNFIEWTNDSLVVPFFEKLKNSHQRKVKVLHIGDSHIQFDVVSGTVRSHFQEIFGAGGRGLVFPYSAARTNSAYDYLNYHTGYWENAKNIHFEHHFEVGVSGATIHTTDSRASFKLIFQRGTIQPYFTNIRLYARQSPQSYQLKLHYSAQNEPITLRLNDSTATLPYIEFQLPKASDTLEFLVEKTSPEQKYVEINGLSIENQEDRGILYHSVGINGAGYKSVLRQALFQTHLQSLQPDLVVVDLGINDFRAGRIHTDDLRNDISRMVDSLRIVLPQSLILLTNVQDAYRGKRNIAECQVFAELVKQVALQKHCAFYNYYEVAGGRFSMLKWLNQNLAQYDRLHLTPKGYRVRGELYKNALLNTFHHYLNYGQKDTFLVEKFVPETLNIPVVAQQNKTVEKAVAQIKTPHQQAQITYTVKKGDSLGEIAEKFGVSTQSLREWNRLKSDKILAGNVLWLYTDVDKVPTAKRKKGLQPVNYKNAGVHTVQKGDSLWEIAQRYGTTVDKLKNVNNLTSNKLQIGQKLKIVK